MLIATYQYGHVAGECQLGSIPVKMSVSYRQNLQVFYFFKTQLSSVFYTIIIVNKMFGDLKCTSKHVSMNELRHKSVSTRLWISRECIYGLYQLLNFEYTS